MTAPLIDIRHLTLADVSKLAGLQVKDTCLARTENSAENCPPGHDCAECEHYEVASCDDCGGELSWKIEFTAARPNGTGYEIVVCEECATEHERRWVGF